MWRWMMVCVLLLLLGGGGYRLFVSQDRYASFFDALAARGDSSYRLLFVWVQGDQPQFRPVGGDAVTAAECFDRIEELLAAMARRPWLRSQIEWVLDEATYEAHELRLTSLKRRYPEHFSWTFWTELVPRYPEIAGALAQCQHGVPALCSDLLRIWHLPSDYDVNVYMDVDTFHARLAQAKVPTDLSLGVRLSGHGIYHSVYREQSAASSMCNNDLLIDYHGRHWDLIRALALHVLEDYRVPWMALTWRHRWRALGYDEYERNGVTRWDWWQAHPSHNVHPLGRVVSMLGPWFWLHLTAEGRSRVYEVPSVPNRGSWKGGSDVVIKGSMDYQALRYWLGSARAQEVLQLLLWVEDYRYLDSFGVPWRCSVAERIRAQWQAWSEEERALYASVFFAPVAWAKEIAETACLGGSSL